MSRMGTIVVTIMLVAAMATAGYGQTGAMTADQMKMMSGHMKTMSDQMKGGLAARPSHNRLRSPPVIGPVAVQ